MGATVRVLSRLRADRDDGDGDYQPRRRLPPKSDLVRQAVSPSTSVMHVIPGSPILGTPPKLRPVCMRIGPARADHATEHCVLFWWEKRGRKQGRSDFENDVKDMAPAAALLPELSVFWAPCSPGFDPRNDSILIAGHVAAHRVGCGARRTESDPRCCNRGCIPEFTECVRTA